MKKQGKLNLAKHMIGDKMPIVAFLGLSVTTLSGCNNENSAIYTAYTHLSTCAKDNGSDICNARFAAAKAEGERTAVKYQVERDCQQDYGDLCYPHHGIWSPKIVGFVVEKKSDFVLPFYTSANSASSNFGYVFTARGGILTRFEAADGKRLFLNKNLTTALPTSKLSTYKSMGGSYQQSRSHSIVSDITDAYIISRAIDGSSQYVTEREKRKAAQGSGGYTVTSGTARTTSGAYKSESRQSSSSTETYQYKPKVTTVSRGGFGRTGSFLGGFGG